jgi:hypothetical protein
VVEYRGPCSPNAICPLLPPSLVSWWLSGMAYSAFGESQFKLCEFYLSNHQRWLPRRSQCKGLQWSGVEWARPAGQKETSSLPHPNKLHPNPSFCSSELVPDFSSGLPQQNTRVEANRGFVPGRSLQVQHQVQGTGLLLRLSSSWPAGGASSLCPRKTESVPVSLICTNPMVGVPPSLHLNRLLP